MKNNSILLLIAALVLQPFTASAQKTMVVKMKNGQKSTYYTSEIKSIAWTEDPEEEDLLDRDSGGIIQGTRNVTTGDVSGLSATGVTIHCNVLDLTNVTTIGVTYAKVVNEEVGTTEVVTVPLSYVDKLGLYEVVLNNVLEPNTAYFYSAFLVRDGVQESGAQKAFITLGTDGSMPITLGQAYDITNCSAKARISIKEDFPLKEWEVYYGRSLEEMSFHNNLFDASTNYDDKTVLDFNNLDGNTVYYYRFVAYNEHWWNYPYYFGPIMSFRTAPDGNMLVAGEPDKEYCVTTQLHLGQYGYDIVTDVRLGLCWTTNGDTPFPALQTKQVSNGDNYSRYTRNVDAGYNYTLQIPTYGDITYRPFAAFDDRDGYLEGIHYGDVKTFTNKPQVGEAVDLGLSVKWATFNVGATAPEEYGGHFAWGETSPKVSYLYENYFDCEPTDISWETYYKYNFSDGFSTLQPEDDVAQKYWGGTWRMPTQAELEELVNKCTWTEETLNGIRGRRATGPNGNSIFLPFAGYKYDQDLYNDSKYIRNQYQTYDQFYGYYMSSQLLQSQSSWATSSRYIQCLYMSSSDNWNSATTTISQQRCYGLSIRAVCE